MLNALKSTLRIPAVSLGRMFQTSAPSASDKFDHKRIPLEDEGVQGEKVIDLDAALKS